jgi:hypothetical protein
MIWWVNMNIVWDRYNTSSQRVFNNFWNERLASSSSLLGRRLRFLWENGSVADGPLHSLWDKDERGVTAPLTSGMIAAKERFRRHREMPCTSSGGGFRRDLPSEADRGLRSESQQRETPSNSLVYVQKRLASQTAS